MVELSDEPLDHVFQALAHPVRREMLRRLGDGELSVSALGEPFAMSLEAVSKHVQVLERAALLQRTRRGRSHYCRLRPEPLREASAVLQRLADHWNRQLDNLERLLDEPE